MKSDFYGLATRAIENSFVRVEFLAEAGPRIVRLFLHDSDENWLAELPDKRLNTSLGDYFFRGGHRLWYAPESIPITYQPDNAGVIVEEIADGVCLHQPPEPLTDIRKSIELHLHATRASLTLTHRIENAGARKIELAPWAITMLPLGAVVILPQNTHAIDKDGLQPNRNLVLWQYTHINDARLELRDDAIHVHARAQLPPCKIGYLNRAGWMAYWRNENLFVKRFAVDGEAGYPDFHCNAEVYCNDQFVELETLAPMQWLESNQIVEHIETWEFYRGVQQIEQLQELMK
jgi:hypothetical protein